MRNKMTVNMGGFDDHRVEDPLHMGEDTDKGASGRGSCGKNAYG
jgi:hypothetical protein